ncbi:unnamed protein product [Caenorhabditis sp. 36 PRJEB53466]|nr:unnamed protein product [Caenorhabditis sp. 36 PRJEB53466]
MVVKPGKPCQTSLPMPETSCSSSRSPQVGTLPTEYKRMSESRKEPADRPPSNKMYMLIPMLICVSLVWFAWSQWHNPPQVQHRPPQRAQDPAAKKRVWWMPDLLKTLPPFADGYRAEKYVEKYNITSCYINGNFPELNAAIFCYLFDSQLFANENRTISEDLSGDGLCGASPPLTMTSWEQWKKLLTKKVRRIAVVQHPLERFARQFRQICEIEQKCFDCKDSIACFMRKILKEHQKLAEGLQGHIRTFLTNNFSPQTWNCHFNRDFLNIETLKLGGNATEKAQFVGNLNAVLGEQGVSPAVQKIIRDEVMKIPMEMSKEELKIMKTVREDEDLWRLFRYLYEHDFTIFGYTL